MLNLQRSEFEQVSIGLEVELWLCKEKPYFKSALMSAFNFQPNRLALAAKVRTPLILLKNSFLIDA